MFIEYFIFKIKTLNANDLTYSLYSIDIENRKHHTRIIVFNIIRRCSVVAPNYTTINCLIKFDVP